MVKQFGIVGALILGEAAVTANIVSPILVIIVALTGISEFAIPDFSFSFSVRIFRFIYIILGYIAGLFGISAGIFIHLCYVLSTKSFGVPIFSFKEGASYPVKPLWENETRNQILNTKRPESAPKTSMDWRK